LFIALDISLFPIWVRLSSGHNQKLIFLSSASAVALNCQKLIVELPIQLILSKGSIQTGNDISDECPVSDVFGVRGVSAWHCSDGLCWMEQHEISPCSRGCTFVLSGHATGQRIYPAVALAVASGARRGEILAVRWKDIDMAASTMRVEQALEETTEGGLRLKPPKTKNGRRVIALPAAVVTEQRGLWKAQIEERFKLGLGKLADEALVFAHPDGKLLSPDALSKAWRKARSDHRLPKGGLHALRHTHASQLIAGGTDIVTVSRRLGHGNPTVTLTTYAHLFEKTDAAAAKAIEAALRTTTER